MRQTGMLAACVAYALDHNFPQLPRVHALAKKLEDGLEEIGAIILSRAETCMVGLADLFFFSTDTLAISHTRFSMTPRPSGPILTRSLSVLALCLNRSSSVGLAS